LGFFFFFFFFFFVFLFGFFGSVPGRPLVTPRIVFLYSPPPSDSLYEIAVSGSDYPDPIHSIAVQVPYVSPPR